MGETWRDSPAATRPSAAEGLVLLGAPAPKPAGQPSGLEVALPGAWPEPASARVMRLVPEKSPQHEDDQAQSESDADDPQPGQALRRRHRLPGTCEPA